jgi:hypothetical protein
MTATKPVVPRRSPAPVRKEEQERDEQSISALSDALVCERSKYGWQQFISCRRSDPFAKGEALDGPSDGAAHQSEQR